jgi:hypothetical protein
MSLGFKGSLVFMSLGFGLYIWLFVLGQKRLNNIERRQPPLFPPPINLNMVSKP